jgi:DNA-binding CsgD family transcriptional regulator
MRLDAEGLLDLVDQIHAGGTCDIARKRSVEALSDAFGGAAVMLFRQAGAIVEDLDHARWPKESVHLCSGHYCDPGRNEMLRAMPALPIGVPMRADAAGDGVFERSEVYREGMKPFGLAPGPLGALIARTARDTSSISLMAHARALPFARKDEELLARLIPALTSADRVRRLLVEAMETRQMLEGALDRVGRPVAVVDDHLGLRYANAPARGLLEDGSALRIGSGRISAADPRANERLRAIVRAAVARGGTARFVPLGERRKANVLRVEPLRPGEAGVARPLALIVGNRPSSVQAGDLRVLYGLSPREADTAVLFAEGLGILDAATRLGRSVNTVKTAARAIYAKLGVRGHAEAAARIRGDLNA